MLPAVNVPVEVKGTLNVLPAQNGLAVIVPVEIVFVKGAQDSNKILPAAPFPPVAGPPLTPLDAPPFPPEMFEFVACTNPEMLLDFKFIVPPLPPPPDPPYAPPLLDDVPPFPPFTEINPVGLKLMFVAVIWIAPPPPPPPPPAALEMFPLLPPPPPPEPPNRLVVTDDCVIIVVKATSP
jgi:hypothetical protein